MTLQNDRSKFSPLTGGQARLIFPCVLIAVLLPSLAMLFRPVPHIQALAEHGVDGYVLNNNVGSTNSITVFARNDDGSLTLLHTKAIGGLGSVTAFADGTQGSLIITHDGRFAYTSNPDSQAISGLRIGKDGAISLLNANGLTASTPSDTFPLDVSLSSNSRFLYVLDSRLLLKPQPGLATLSGFLVHHDGSLTSVVNPAKIVLPFSAIGLAAE